MKKKPRISYDRERDQFKKNGYDIPELEAFEIWENATGDWTQGAFQEMAQRVLS